MRGGARALVARDERPVLPRRRLGGFGGWQRSRCFPVAVQGEDEGGAQDVAGAVGDATGVEEVVGFV